MRKKEKKRGYLPHRKPGGGWGGVRLGRRSENRHIGETFVSIISISFLVCLSVVVYAKLNV